MVEIEQKPGLSVQIGPYTLWVLAINAGEVAFALFDPDLDCASCGERPAGPVSCPDCLNEFIICSLCASSWRCSDCGVRGGG